MNVRVAVVLVLALTATPASAGDLIGSPGDIRGDWGSSGLTPPQDDTLRYWLSDTDVATGVVELEIEHAGRIDLSVAFGVRTNAEGKLDGLVLRIKKDRFRFETIKGDRRTPASDWARLSKLKKATPLTLRAYVTRSSILVDATGSGRLVGSITGPRSSGRLGVVLFARDTGAGQIHRFSTSSGCGLAGLHEQSRFVVMQKAAVPDGPLFDIIDGIDAGVVVKTTQAGLATLICDRTPIVAIPDAIPLRWVDPARASPLIKIQDNGDKGETWVPGDRYKDAAEVASVLERIHERWPQNTILMEIGRSHNDQPIMALAVSRGIEQAGARPAVLLNAAHHGNEPLSADFVLDAALHMLQADEAWLDDVVVWCIPVVNPDGLTHHVRRDRRSGRKNGLDSNEDGTWGRRDGVDLNRNYPFQWAALGETGSKSAPTHVWYRGAAAGSEPETRAVMALANQERFWASLSYHIGNNTVLAPYTINETRNPEPNEAWAVGEAIVEMLPPHPDDGAYDLRMQIYPVDGTDQDWHRHTNGTVALLVEGSGQSPLDVEKRAPILEVVRASWLALAEQLRGPAVVGRVVDVDGNPVQAQIRIEGQTLHENERWLTRCRDGGFARFVTTPGPVTVIAAIDGVEIARRTVQVESAPVRVLLQASGSAQAEACGGLGPWPRVTAKQLLINADRVRAAGAMGVMATLHPPERRNEAQVPSSSQPTGAKSSAPPADDADEETGCGCTQLRPTGPRPWTGLLSIGLVLLFCVGWRTTRVCYGPR